MDKQGRLTQWGEWEVGATQQDGEHLKREGMA